MNQYDLIFVTTKDEDDKISAEIMRILTVDPGNKIYAVPELHLLEHHNNKHSQSKMLHKVQMMLECATIQNLIDLAQSGFLKPDMDNIFLNIYVYELLDQDEDLWEDIDNDIPAIIHLVPSLEEFDKTFASAMGFPTGSAGSYHNPIELPTNRLMGVSRADFEDDQLDRLKLKHEDIMNYRSSRGDCYAIKIDQSTHSQKDIEAISLYFGNEKSCFAKDGNQLYFILIDCQKFNP